MRRIAIATCRPLPEPDPDENLLLKALRARVVEPVMVPWHDDPDLSSYDACVLRSTWDYDTNPAAFERWLERAAAQTRLLNPLAACRWNLHKGYLRDLEAAGVPIVPTQWRRRAEPFDCRALLARPDWHEVVIKPAISAASHRTRRFTRDEAVEAQAFCDTLARDGDVMVQRFLPSVAGDGPDDGERSLVWIAGELTHAIRKQPRFDTDDESVSDALTPSGQERAFAYAVLDAAPLDPGDLLYARIDIMRGPDHEPLLSELELIEPSLFLMQHPPALARLADAITQYAGVRP